MRCYFCGHAKADHAEGQWQCQVEGWKCKKFRVRVSPMWTKYAFAFFLLLASLCSAALLINPSHSAPTPQSDMVDIVCPACKGKKSIDVVDGETDQVVGQIKCQACGGIGTVKCEVLKVMPKEDHK